MNVINGWQKLSLQTAPYNESPVGRVKPACHVYEWKIDNFYSLTKKFIFSRYFNFINIPFRIQMSWATSNERTRNVSISLQKTSDMHSAFGDTRPSSSMVIPYVDTTIGFKRLDGSIFDPIHKVIEMQASSSLGFQNELSAIYSIPFSVWEYIEVSDDSLTVMCVLRISASAVSEPLPRFKSILTKDLEELLRSERDADVTMRVQGRQFKAHRSILVARSTVFATMFQHNMTERTMNEVNIDDCDPDSFQDFLVYLYTGKTNQVTSDNARDLYITADKYLVEELKAKCSMCLTLTCDSTCDVLVLAKMHNDSKLLVRATDFFVKNFKKILQSPSWLEFQPNYKSLADELLEKL